jgi:23S rRNA (guanosine2251-2'-O)-methyltransferase
VEVGSGDVTEVGALYGRHPVLELLRNRTRRADEVAVLAGGHGSLEEIVALARQAGIKVSRRTRDQLTAMAGSPHHQGVVARVSQADYVPLEDLLRVPAARGEAALFLALDQVQDPRNLGALLRTAEVLGVHGVIIPRHRAVGLTEAAARVATGALELVPVARAGNLVTALGSLKEAGIWVYGAVPSGGIAAWEADFRRPACLVLGGEGGGLRPLVARTCDVLLTVPMRGRLGSLNVGAAGAVLCYEARRQRARLEP